jgi:hypothetical protein
MAVSVYMDAAAIAFNFIGRTNFLVLMLHLLYHESVLERMGNSGMR